MSSPNQPSPNPQRHPLGPLAHLPSQVVQAAFGTYGNAQAMADPRMATAAQAPYQRYREMTIDELLLENRVIFLVGEINYSSATGVIMRLLHLQNQKQGVDINLYVNSPGGSVDDTLA